jgi:hypothetical protein
VNNALCAADCARPGELLSLVMDGLASAGLDVQQGEGSRVAIAWPGARCQLAVSDWGTAEWEFWPQFPAGADPALAADAATTLLTGRQGPFPRLADGSGSATFKGAVGRELKARGLEVTLAMYADEVGFDAVAEVVATAPGDADTAQVTELLKPVLQEMDRKLDTLTAKMDALLAALARWDSGSIDALLARLDAQPGAVPRDGAPGQEGALPPCPGQ